MTAFYSVKESQGRLGDLPAGGNGETKAAPHSGAVTAKVTAEGRGGGGKPADGKVGGIAGGAGGYVGVAEGTAGGSQNTNTHKDAVDDAEFYKAAVMHAGIPVVPLDLLGCIAGW